MPSRCPLVKRFETNILSSRQKTLYQLSADEPDTFVVTGGANSKLVELVKLRPGAGGFGCPNILPPLPNGDLYRPGTVGIRDRDGAPLACGGAVGTNGLPAITPRQCHRFNFNALRWETQTALMTNDHVTAASARFPGGDYLVVGTVGNTGQDDRFIAQTSTFQSRQRSV